MECTCHRSRHVGREVSNGHLGWNFPSSRILCSSPRSTPPYIHANDHEDDVVDRNTDVHVWTTHEFGLCDCSWTSNSTRSPCSRRPRTPGDGPDPRGGWRRRSTDGCHLHRRGDRDGRRLAGAFRSEGGYLNSADMRWHSHSLTHSLALHARSFVRKSGTDAASTMQERDAKSGRWRK